MFFIQLILTRFHAHHNHSMASSTIACMRREKEARLQRAEQGLARFRAAEGRIDTAFAQRMESMSTSALIGLA